MTSNSVHNRLLNFAMEEITFARFQKILFASSKEEPVRVAWETNEGNNRYYWMYWDRAEYTADAASKTKSAEGMVNIQCLGDIDDWRTLDYTSVSKVHYNGKTYKVK